MFSIQIPPLHDVSNLLNAISSFTWLLQKSHCMQFHISSFCSHGPLQIGLQVIKCRWLLQTCFYEVATIGTQLSCATSAIHHVSLGTPWPLLSGDSKVLLCSPPQLDWLSSSFHSSERFPFSWKDSQNASAILTSCPSRGLGKTSNSIHLKQRSTFLLHLLNVSIKHPIRAEACHPSLFCCKHCCCSEESTSSLLDTLC